MKTLKIQPFDYNLYFFTDKEELINWINKEHPNSQDIIDKLKSSIGLMIEFDKQPIFALYVESLDSLDHELIHATWFILNFAGVIIDRDNHEIQAYFFEYLKKLILES